MNEPETTLSDEIIEFLDEGSDTGSEGIHASTDHWPVLIVDDEEYVHQATTYALGSELIEGRPLEFLHAYSAKEAQELIRTRSDVAVILLDVVMEHENSGLELVRILRNELNMHTVRIILRTGQPGYAPETQVIRDYDINDYRLKSELTQTTLVTALTSAIRSYDQLCSILASRRGLAQIIESANDLLIRRSLSAFAEGVLMQLFKLIDHAPDDILFCSQYVPSDEVSAPPLTKIIDASGIFTPYIGQPLEQIGPHQAVLDSIRQCLDSRKNQHDSHSVTLFLPGDTNRDAVLHFTVNKALTLTENQLLDVFSVNVAIGLKNVCLFDDLHFLAFSDPLTGLLNRKGFIDAIAQHAGKNEQDWTVALIDFDHFAEVNDALGHNMGDALLIGIAHRLQANWGKDCLLARVGADVFGLFAPDISLTPSRLTEVFHAPVCVDGYLLPLPITVGLTRLSEENGSAIDLFRSTSSALKHAKHDLRGQCHYHTRDMTETAHKRLILLDHLRHAVTTKEGLKLHYQPQLELRSGRVIGVEALLRWTNNDGQNIPPDQFISLAENSGLMVELGEWVFRTGITQLLKWDAVGLPPLRMAINLSLIQFREINFTESLIRIIDEFKIPAHRLELEITESIAMLDVDTVIQTLSEFKKKGMEVSIDDFGTGFSSLSYLHRLPVDRLKIDQSFVRAMSAAGGSGNTIANLVINLAHSLDLSVIAEGVETQDHARLLLDMGCDLGQGFLYARALAPEVFEDWLKKRQTA
jgi:diguanylate cyclase (GGDEF)-like protein